MVNREKGGEIARGSILLIELEKELFEKLEKDYKDIKYNIKK